ncbi:hypothetical protein RhiJN_10323 [Ceratobasidium sp. AG-Ba]|nr:hypothetical protein RhiJN_10319 [Ceratobasidium sp. AG-Ba]QRV82308.1 hypothetical protein RhiJN_10323 [Ceratobasidium sp. AG-Ba]
MEPTNQPAACPGHEPQLDSASKFLEKVLEIADIAPENIQDPSANPMANVQADMPALVHRYSEIRPYFLGWTRISYIGPESSFPFLDRETYFNVCRPDEEYVNSLATSFDEFKRDHEFPIDLMVSPDHLDNKFRLEAAACNGQYPEQVPPILRLKGQTEAELREWAEVWYAYDFQECRPLSQDEINTRTNHYRDRASDSSRPKAYFLNGRQRDLACHRKLVPIYDVQRQIRELLKTPDLDEEAKATLAKLLKVQQGNLQAATFRARIYDIRMPEYLKSEIAKNQQPMASARPPSFGEDVYMSCIEHTDLVAKLEREHPHWTRQQIMSQWHLVHVASPKVQAVQPLEVITASATQAPAPASAKDSKNQKKLTVWMLLSNPMGAEMILSCGKTESLFNILSYDHVEKAVSDVGGLMMATIWLDMRLTLRLCNVTANHAKRVEINQYLAKIKDDPLSADGDVEAVGLWNQICPDTLKNTRALHMFEGKWGDHYTKLWQDNWSKADMFNRSSNDIVHHRRMFLKFADYLETSTDQDAVMLAMGCRLYAHLRLYENNSDQALCSFIPTADLACKKKFSALARLTSKNYTGTGNTIISMALGRSDIIWPRLKAPLDWYTALSGSLQVMRYCVQPVILAPESGLYDTQQYLGSVECTNALKAAEKHYSGYGPHGQKFQKLATECSVSKSGPHHYPILESLWERESMGFASVDAMRKVFQSARLRLADMSRGEVELSVVMQEFPILQSTIGKQYLEETFGRIVSKTKTGQVDMKSVNQASGYGIFVAELERVFWKVLNDDAVKELPLMARDVLRRHHQSLNMPLPQFWWSRHYERMSRTKQASPPPPADSQMDPAKVEVPLVDSGKAIDPPKEDTMHGLDAPTPLVSPDAKESAVGLVQEAEIDASDSIKLDDFINTMGLLPTENTPVQPSLQDQNDNTALDNIGDTALSMAPLGTALEKMDIAENLDGGLVPLPHHQSKSPDMGEATKANTRASLVPEPNSQDLEPEAQVDPTVTEDETTHVAQEKPAKRHPRKMIVLLPAPRFSIPPSHAKGSLPKATPGKLARPLRAKKLKSPKSEAKAKSSQPAEIKPRQQRRSPSWDVESVVGDSSDELEGNSVTGSDLDEEAETKALDGEQESSEAEAQPQLLESKSKTPEEMEWEQAASDIELMVMPMRTPPSQHADSSDDEHDPKVKPEPQDYGCEAEPVDLDMLKPVPDPNRLGQALVSQELCSQGGSSNSDADVDPSTLLPVVWCNNKHFKRFDQILGPLPPFLRCPYYLDNMFPHHLCGTLVALRNKENWRETDVIIRRTLQELREHLVPTLQSVVSVRINFIKQIGQQVLLALHQSETSEESYFFDVLPAIMFNLKKNYMTQIARVFHKDLPVEMEAAITDAIFMAVSDGLFESDIIQWNEKRKEYLVDFRCAMPGRAEGKADDKNSVAIGINYMSHLEPPANPYDVAWSQPSMMFQDGYGRGVSESQISSGVTMAGYLQFLSKQPGHFMKHTMDFARQHGQMKNLASSLIKDQLAQNEPMDGRTDSDLGWLKTNDAAYSAWTRWSCFSYGQIWDQALFEKDVPFHFEIQTLLNNMYKLWATAWNKEHKRLEAGLGLELKKIHQELDERTSQATEVNVSYAEKATSTGDAVVQEQAVKGAVTQAVVQVDEDQDVAADVAVEVDEEPDVAADVAVAVAVVQDADMASTLLANNALNLLPAAADDPDDPDHVFSSTQGKAEHKRKLSETMESEGPAAKRVHPDEE